MKTIAVLTDFSKGAEHAIQLALHMAKKMKAEVLLFKVGENALVKQPVFADHEDSSQKTRSLDDFSREMSAQLHPRTIPGSHVPEILTDTDNADLVDVMTTIMANKEICLIITAPRPGSELSAFLISELCNRIIDWANVPVLVVPETAQLRNFEKIAFASQLHEEDINSIAELGNLMECFAAELMVAHLNEHPSDAAIRAAENDLNRAHYKKLDCGGVYFRSVNDTQQPKSWNWLQANKRTDLLAVVQQPREQMSHFFERGRSASVTYHLTIPVMILPKRP